MVPEQPDETVGPAEGRHAVVRARGRRAVRHERALAADHPIGESLGQGELGPGREEGSVVARTSGDADAAQLRRDEGADQAPQGGEQ